MRIMYLHLIIIQYVEDVVGLVVAWVVKLVAAIIIDEQISSDFIHFLQLTSILIIIKRDTLVF